MMKLIGSHIWIEFEEAVSSGISESTLKLAKHRQSKSWTFMNDPDDKRKVLIHFRSMKLKYRTLIEQKLTNGQDPKKWYLAQEAKSKIIEQDEAIELLEHKIKPKADAMNYYLDHNAVCNDVEAHELATIASYFDWANGLKGALDAKKWGFISKKDALKGMLEIFANSDMKAMNAISSYSYLRKKLSIYKAEGLESLISGKKGNKNPLKFGKQAKLFVKNAYGDGRGFDIHEIYMVFLRACADYGWTPVCRTTIYNYCMSAEVQRTAAKFRRTTGKYRNDFDLQIPIEKVPQPWMQWEVDGTPAEIYYQDQDGKQKRLYLVTVIDVATQYVVGFDIGRSETTQLVQNAVKNAVKLCGGLAYEIRFDQGAANTSHDATSLFDKLFKYVRPAGVANPRSKTIEPNQGLFQTKILRYYPHFSGLGVQTKRENSHANTDYLKQIAQEGGIPSLDQAMIDIRQAIAVWNHQTMANGQKRHIAQFENKEYLRQLSPLEEVDIFWQYKMAKNGALQTYKYSSNGIEIVMDGQKRRYYVLESDDTPDLEFHLNYMGDRFSVKYSIDDPSTIYLYQDGKIITEARSEYKKAIRTAVDKTREDHAHLAKWRAKKKALQEAFQQDAEQSLQEAERDYKVAFAFENRFKDELNAAEEWLKKTNMVLDHPYAPIHSKSIKKRSLYGDQEATLKPVKTDQNGQQN